MHSAGWLLLLSTLALAQEAPNPRFDVASIKLDTSGNPPKSNFPLGPGDVYVRNGGRFYATGFPLVTYLSFAYKLIGNQAQFVLPQLPEWATRDRYDIEARIDPDPGKDGMRLAMRDLLADRFGLRLHYEAREVPVFALTLIKTGKPGKELVAHPDASDCPTEQPPTAPAIVNGKPMFCNGIYDLPPTVPGRLRFAGRNVTIGFIADTFSAGTNLGRPMIDGTGLEGRFDFTMEWQQLPRVPRPGAEAPPEAEQTGPTFEEALRDQLGIKLQARKGPLRVLVIDKVERPTAN
jgi:uncharacterized protein (TIGR03435 family)